MVGRLWHLIDYLTVFGAELGASNNLAAPWVRDALGLSRTALAVLTYEEIQTSLVSLPEGLAATPGLVIALIVVAVAELVYFYIYGDGHLVTIDGLRYDFKAVGVSWLLLSTATIYTQYKISGFAMHAQLQPLSCFISPGSPAALSCRGVTCMASIAFQADSTCALSLSRPTHGISVQSSLLLLLILSMPALMLRVPTSQQLNRLMRPLSRTSSHVLLSTSRLQILR